MSRSHGEQKVSRNWRHRKQVLDRLAVRSLRHHTRAALAEHLKRLPLADESALVLADLHEEQGRLALAQRLREGVALVLPGPHRE